MGYLNWFLSSIAKPLPTRDSEEALFLPTALGFFSCLLVDMVKENRAIANAESRMILVFIVLKGYLLFRATRATKLAWVWSGASLRFNILLSAWRNCNSCDYSEEDCVE